MKRLKLCISLTLIVAATAALWNAPRLTIAAAQEVQFNRDIRPLLSNRCFYCHGPDEKNRKAGLRLDTFEGATKDRGGYRAIAPGKPEESELLRRVTSHDPSEMMPPPPAKKPTITAQEAELLRRWIAQGAKYQGHWAFQPLATAPAPKVKNTKWARNEIDRFILARLEREGIAPSPEADARTLIRRLSLDLTGLLPQPAEVEAFVEAYNQINARKQEAAYNALVERLLASPHYGERWGRHWLDQARYADSNGYTLDGDRVMWPYRDWVIQALNQDMPFNQFTIEQLAGDLSPEPTTAQLVATGFHRNTVINEEGGVDPEQARVEQVMDRVNTTGAVWLGLTIGCAQCHSHKFDPISHKEYYRMFAFFNSTMDFNNQGPVTSVRRGEMVGKPETETPEEQFDQLGPKRGELKQDNWEKLEIARLERDPAVTAQDKAVAWHSIESIKIETEANGKLRQLDDGSFLITASASANDAYRILARIDSPRLAAVRLRALPHETLPKNGPGLAADGSFALSEFYIESEGDIHNFISAFAPSAEDEQSAYPARAAADGDRRTGWSINNNAQPREAVFVSHRQMEFTSRLVQFIMRHEADARRGLGRFKIEVAEETPHDALGAALLAALKLPLNERSPEQQTMVNAAFASARAVREKQAAAAVLTMIMRDIDTPRETYIFARGDFTRPDKAAGLLQPGVISAIAPALPETGKARTRLDLARWLVDPANPLTPRVTVNRIWMRYFGRGIVETEEDFGAQGSPPSHPYLLDWLAVHYREDCRWSLKALIKSIVASSTYQQAFVLDAQRQEQDPRNVWLSRGSRQRLSAEV
ncbi:MAG TPA: PSD1 and planctomycete cytochrome C domain-containing protein, partial [Blastocatellia bacterium]|nr:PSD1 and planctomycete cytochrome C domain-containing protein [Blastocatellia bacterium]